MCYKHPYIYVLHICVTNTHTYMCECDVIVGMSLI